MSAASRPGQPTKAAPAAPVAQPAAAPVAQPAAPAQNAAQAKFAVKQKGGGMDFGSSYGTPKPQAAAKVTPEPPKASPGNGPSLAAGAAAPGAQPGAKIQPKTNEPAAKVAPQPAGAQFQQKTSQPGQQGQQTNGVGSQPKEAPKFGGGAGFGTQFKPKGAEEGKPGADGAQGGVGQKFGKFQNPEPQQQKSFSKRIMLVDEEKPQAADQGSNAKPQQDASTAQSPKPLGVKVGQKPAEQPLLQQKQQQQQLSQPAVQQPQQQKLLQAQPQQQQQQLGGPQQQQQKLLGQQQQQQQSLLMQQQQQLQQFQQQPQQKLLGSQQPAAVQQQQQPQLPPQVRPQEPEPRAPPPQVAQKPTPPPAVAPKPAAPEGQAEAGFKPGQVLVIKPDHEIKFEGPFSALSSVELTLSNPTDRAVCYKVKSNAPHYYFVKPAGDLIPPHQQASVYLMLQTPSGERNPTTDDKHKFMIQSLVVQDGQSTGNGLERLWKSVGQNEIMETKIPCVFVDAPYRPPPPSSSYSSYTDDSRSSLSSVDDRRETKTVKKQKEEKSSSSSSSWLLFIIIPILLALIAFAAYKLHFEKDMAKHMKYLQKNFGKYLKYFKK